MHVFSELPASYEKVEEIKLQGNKRLAVGINAAGSLLMVILLLIGHFLLVPVWTAFEFEIGTTMMQAMMRPIAMIVGSIAYIVLHELTHGAAMKYFGARSVRFGFTGLYAYAGSERDWFDKTSYLVVTLAPLVLWGVFFTAMLIFVPRTWFWVVYLWQIMNITGSVGDVYVAWRTGRMPADMLARDTGVEMALYSQSR